jgi:hypothetical protein
VSLKEVGKKVEKGKRIANEETGTRIAGKLQVIETGNVGWNRQSKEAGGICLDRWDARYPSWFRVDRWGCAVQS